LDGSLRLWHLKSGRERFKISMIEGYITDIFFRPGLEGIRHQRR